MSRAFLVFGVVSAAVAAAAAAASSSPEHSVEEARHLRGGSSGASVPAEAYEAGVVRENVTDPTLELRSSFRGLYCIRVVTGQGANNDGTLSWSIRNGDVLTIPSNAYYARGQTVLDECFFDAMVSLIVENTGSNAWAGSALYSTDGGRTYDPMWCETCTAVGSTDKLVVDGNSDSGDQAATRCFNGARCNIVPTAPHLQHCLMVFTGHSANNDGTLTWNIQTGDALTIPLSSYYTKGQMVVERCFDAMFTLIVENAGHNAWAGSALYSADAGLTYHPMWCETCTKVGGTDKFVVDGNADSGDQAATRCFNGARCNIVPAAPRLQHCLKVVTGHSANNEGTLTWNIQTGDALTIPLSSYYAKGQMVVERCFFDAMFTLIVENAGHNAWAGSALYSADGGRTYHPMRCETCTKVGGTDKFVVDGNADSGDQAATQCFHGASCKIVPHLR